MAPMLKHFLPNGKEYKGPTHSMNGRLMTGAVHTPSSVLLTHKGSMGAPKKAMTDMGARMAKLRAMRR